MDKTNEHPHAAWWRAWPGPGAKPDEAVASVVERGTMTGCTVADLDDLLGHAIGDIRALLAEVEALRVRVATLITNTKGNP